MSSDEKIVTVMAVFIGPVLWTVWLVQMSRVQMLHRGQRAVAAIASALAVCTVLIFVVLKTGASYDVREAPAYLFMYVMLGLAWSRAAAITFTFAGLSPRDDVIERRNQAALTATIGGLIAVTLCYPSTHGTYLATAVVYSTVFERSPIGLSYTPATIAANDTQFLQNVAWETVQEYRKA